MLAHIGKRRLLCSVNSLANSFDWLALLLPPWRRSANKTYRLVGNPETQLDIIQRVGGETSCPWVSFGSTFSNGPCLHLSMPTTGDSDDTKFLPGAVTLPMSVQ